MRLLDVTSRVADGTDHGLVVHAGQIGVQLQLASHPDDRSGRTGRTDPTIDVTMRIRHRYEDYGMGELEARHTVESAAANHHDASERTYRGP